MIVNSYKHIKWIGKNRILISNHSNLKNAKNVICNEVKFDSSHIYIKNGVHHFINQPKKYNYESNVELTNLCTKPQINLFIKDISTYKSIAEIGARYGSSSKYILDNNKVHNIFDIYELSDNFISIIKERLKDYSNFNLICGNAEETLKSNSNIYDLVFFDCSHIYDIDKKIFDNLIPHINKETLLIFDDYYLDDVKALVQYAKEKCPNNEIIYKQLGAI